MTKTHRTIQNSKKTGTVSRAKALKAAQAVKSNRAHATTSNRAREVEAPYLVKK